MGSRRWVMVAVLASVVVGFSMGLVVGQGMAPARAQTEPTQSVEERAAEIKQRLVAVISARNAALSEEDKRRLSYPSVLSPMARLAKGIYLAELAALARQDTILGHYLRYMSGALRPGSLGRVDQPAYYELLLQDRFLDHFSQELASTGLPPVVPPLTDKELKWLGPVGSYANGEVARDAHLDEWPYSMAAATVFGVD